MNALNYCLRTELGGATPVAPGQPLLALLHLSDAHVMDSVSPARSEWMELLADDPRWKGPMHRPQEALSHWALAAHVEQLHSQPLAPWSEQVFDLALSTGDNIDNAQSNELQAFLQIMAGGRAALSAFGGVHEAGHELGTGAWPFWCPDADVPDLWKPLGYPVVPGYVARASAELYSKGLGFAWASLPGTHDVLRQGRVLSKPALEAIALGDRKALAGPPGFSPTASQAIYLDQPELFFSGVSRQISASPQRRAVDLREWMAAHMQHGALGYGQAQLRSGRADTVIDTEHVRIILLDTTQVADVGQDTIAAAQCDWLEARLAEVEQQPGRLALLASHRGLDCLAQALLAVAHRHTCMVAWLVGHSHSHRVSAHPHPSGRGGGFWEIGTASLIDWPSQTRSVEILRHTDGSVEIVCTLLDHQAPAGSLAALHLDLARRGADAQHMQGAEQDGNVRLLLQR